MSHIYTIHVYRHIFIHFQSFSCVYHIYVYTPKIFINFEAEKLAERFGFVRGILWDLLHRWWQVGGRPRATRATHQQRIRQRIFGVENPGDLSRSSPMILLLVECKQWNLCLTRHGLGMGCEDLTQLFGLELEIYFTLFCPPIEYRFIAIAPLLFPKKWIFWIGFCFDPQKRWAQCTSWMESHTHVI